MGLLDTVFGKLGFRGPLLRQEEALWAEARNLQDLCALTELWLLGDIQSQPCYYGPCDVDGADGLLQALVGLNRCGLLTNNSQEGGGGTGYDYDQYAAVDGFAEEDTTDWLASALHGTRFGLIAHPCKRHRWSGSLPGVTLSWCQGRPVTSFGGQLSRADTAFLYSGCGEEAIEAVCQSLYVTVYDTEPGSNDLWPYLCEVTGQ